ncbi:MAG: YlxR family protein [Clostridiales bacterium]|nr:YlxR family protein [Clostridiales bacterium]
MKRRKVPLRMCVGCREMKPKKELVRVVRDPEGEISIDLRGKKAGRGAYICRAPDCLVKTKTNRMLERSFNQKIPDEIYEKLIRQMNEGEEN